MQLYFQDPKDPADRTPIGFDYSDFLGDDTIGGSSWTVVPDGELVITDAASTPSATVITVAEGVAGTTYRLTNVISTAGGLQESRTAVLPVSADALAGAYLGVSEAAARLWGNFGLESELSAGDLLAATSVIDGLGPYVGTRQSSTQTRAFPRTLLPNGTAYIDLEAPEDILNAFVLLAHAVSEEEGPAVTSESVLDRSLTYATPKAPSTIMRAAALLKPYQLQYGRRW